MNSINLSFAVRPMPTSFHRTSQFAFLFSRLHSLFRSLLRSCLRRRLHWKRFAYFCIHLCNSLCLRLCLRSCSRFLRVCASVSLAFALAVFFLCLRVVSVCAYVCIWLHFLLLSPSFSHDPCVLNIR